MMLIRHRVRPVWRVLAGILAVCFVAAFGVTLASGGFPRGERDMVVVLPTVAALFAYVAWTGRVPGWFAAMHGEQATDD